jgi:hypothetical protein
MHPNSSWAGHSPHYLNTDAWLLNSLLPLHGLHTKHNNPPWVCHSPAFLNINIWLQQPTFSPYQQHQQPQQQLMRMSQPLPNCFAATNSFPAGSVPNQHFSSGMSQPSFLNSFAAPNSFSAGFVPTNLSISRMLVMLLLTSPVHRHRWNCRHFLSWGVVRRAPSPSTRTRYQ